MSIDEISKNATILITKKETGYRIQCFYDVHSAETYVASLTDTITETIQNLQTEILKSNY